MPQVQPDRIKILSDFIAKLQTNFSDKSFTKHLAGLSVDQAAVMLGIRHKLPELIKMIQQIQAAKVSEAKIVDEAEKFKKQEENEKKLDAVAQEIFIVACASTIAMDEVLKFQKESGLENTYENLNEFKGDLNPLSAALAGGRNPEELQKLIDAGADVNFKSPQGNNAAHFAVMFDVGEEVLKVLIAQVPPLEINAKNNLGMTPLDMALIKQAESGKISPLTDILVNNGAEVSVLAGLVKGEEGELGASLKAGAILAKEGDKKLQPKVPPKAQSNLKIKDGADFAEEPAAGATASSSIELSNAQGGDFAAKYLESLGFKVGETEDRATILRRALMKAVESNQPVMALYLIDNGAIVNADVANVAIDTKNMNLIGMIISHSTLDVMKAVEEHAIQTYTPAACLIDAAIDHGMLAANTAGVVGEALTLNAGIMGVAHNNLVEQEVLMEKKHEKEVEAKIAEKINQDEAQKAHEDLVKKEKEEVENEQKKEESETKEAIAKEAEETGSDLFDTLKEVTDLVNEFAQELGDVVEALRGEVIPGDDKQDKNTEAPTQNSEVSFVAKQQAKQNDSAVPSKGGNTPSI